MINFYIYVSLLLIVFALLIKGLYLTKFSPKKIKTITIFIILAMLLRYVSLSILFLCHNIKYLYLLKVFFFLNLISVPLLALTVLYVFVRKDNLNFSYIFIIAFILIGLYSTAIYKCPGLLQSTKNYGYTMFFVKHMYIYWIYIVLNTIILFLTIGLINKKNIIKTGMYLVVIASLVTILEMIIWTMGIVLLQEVILGDVMWIVTLVYTLNKVSKRSRE